MSLILEKPTDSNLHSRISVSPRTIAETCYVPLSIASLMLRQDWLPEEKLDAYGQASLRDVLTMGYHYRELLKVPDLFLPVYYDRHIPVLPAFAHNDGCLSVWCKWCREFHHHGSGEGGRVPHCDWYSPYKHDGAGGYALHERGWCTPEVYRAAPVPYPRLYIAGLEFNQLIPDNGYFNSL